MTLPVSARFRGVAAEDVEERTSRSAAPRPGSPCSIFRPIRRSRATSSVTIETTNDCEEGPLAGWFAGRADSGTVAEAVASRYAVDQRRQFARRNRNRKNERLPPKYAAVVSGTSSAGRGVFLKLKRSSRHRSRGCTPLAVTFVAPSTWRGGKVTVGLRRGSRKVFWIHKPANSGPGRASEVELYMAGSTAIRYRVANGVVDWPRRASLVEEFTTEMAGLVVPSTSKNED